MVLPFHHGARVNQSAEELTLVRLFDTSVVGMLCTVPLADASKYTLNTLIHVKKPADAAGLPAHVQDNIDSIYDQVITNILVVLVSEGATPAETLANILGNAAQKTGIHAFMKATAMNGMPKPKLLLAPGLTMSSPADGVASVSVTTAGTGYTDAVTVTIARAAGDTTGTGATAHAVLNQDGSINAIVIDNPGFGYTANPTVTITANGAGTGAAATAARGSVMSPVIAEGMGVAEKLKGMFYADGPDGTDAQAVAARALVGSKRVAFCDPRVLKTVEGVNVPKAASAIFVGLQAKRDREQGVHWAGSNMVPAGVVGLNRPISYPEDSNFLNANRINTFINRGDGLRAWGVWTCSPDPLWQFIPVVRTHDAVNEAIEFAFLEFADRPATLANLDFMVMSGRRALADFEAAGMLLPGSEFKLGAENSPTQGVQGIFHFAMKYEVPAPMVDIQIKAYRNVEVAYTLLFNSVTGEVTYR